MKHTPIIITTALALALAACGDDAPPSTGKAAVEIKGTNPSSGGRSALPDTSSPLGPAPEAGAPDGRGVIDYGAYEAAVARDGDTVASVAARIGLSASELGAYNGLAPAHELRNGDELVLPPRPGGYDGQQIALATPPASPQTTPQTDATGVQAAPIGGGAPGATGAQPSSTWESAGWSPDLAAAAIDRAGGTGLDAQGNLAAPPSAAQPLPPSPQAPGDLASPQLRQYQTPTGQPKPGQVVMVPSPAQPESLGQPSPGSAAGTQDTFVPLDVTPEPEEETRPSEAVTIEPESAAVEPTPQPIPQPIPQPQPQAQVQPQPQPQVQPQPQPQPQAQPQPETRVASAPAQLRLIRPVPGPIVKHFGQGVGRGSSDGIDFASPVGAPVLAAAGGEVALVSQSLGGLGTIVLVRHQGDYLTVYGRIEKVSVAKGDIVSQGQRIGVVSAGIEPRMHFEVRRGAEGLDPERFF